MGLYKSRRQRSHVVATVSLTPLIDTALTLLVVFMVAAPIAHHVIKVELPRGGIEDPLERSTQELVVSVDKDRTLFLDGKAITRKELIQYLRSLKKEPPHLIFLHIDRSVSYGYALELLSELRQIESIQSVAFDIDLEQTT